MTPGKRAYLISAAAKIVPLRIEHPNGDVSYFKIMTGFYDVKRGQKR